MLIDKFFVSGRKFLGCKYPIMCGAMTWVSDPKLVSTIGNAGGFGLLAGGNTPVDIFEEQIIETKELTDKPFGVNLITLAPVYESQLELVCNLGCPFVVFAGGIPKKSEIEKAKDAMATPQFDSRLPVIPVRALKNEGSLEFAKLQLKLLSELDNNLIDRHAAQYKVEEFWVGALRQAVIEGDVTQGSLMAGQSVGLVDKIQPLNEIISEVVNDAESEFQRLKGIFNRQD